jgi:hypothetical protein
MGGVQKTSLFLGWVGGVTTTLKQRALNRRKKVSLFLISTKVLRFRTVSKIILYFFGLQLYFCQMTFVDSSQLMFVDSSQLSFVDISQLMFVDIQLTLFTFS